jgi:Fur family iron response transcriptional regulator
VYGASYDATSANEVLLNYYNSISMPCELPLRQDGVQSTRLVEVSPMTQPHLTRGDIQCDQVAARPELTGSPWRDVKERLRKVGLRPTRQRMALGWFLFAKGDRHVTAEMLYEEATRAKVPVSLATVYNTLHQFTDFGLLRQVAVDASKTYFDTNNSAHHHFFIEDKNELMDIPMSNLLLGKIPTPPEGYEIARIDVVVRLRRRQG